MIKPCAGYLVGVRFPRQECFRHQEGHVLFGGQNRHVDPWRVVRAANSDLNVQGVHLMIRHLGYDENCLVEFNGKGKINASRRPGMEKIVCIVYNFGSRACERNVEGMNGMTSITEPGRGGGGGSISPFVHVLYFPLYT